MDVKTLRWVLDGLDELGNILHKETPESNVALFDEYYGMRGGIVAEIEELLNKAGGTKNVELCENHACSPPCTEMSIEGGELCAQCQRDADDGLSYEEGIRSRKKVAAEAAAKERVLATLDPMREALYRREDEKRQSRLKARRREAAEL